MKLELLPENDKFLKTVCPPFDFKSTDIDTVDLSRSMLELMHENDGIGLACPQVGLNQRMFVMGLDGVELVCYNPEILNESGKIITIQEGCLSYPDLFMKVKRIESIQIRYQDVLGKVNEDELTGIFARCFLHELDHLNGIVFLDRVGRVTTQMAKQRRHKQRKKS